MEELDDRQEDDLEVPMLAASYDDDRLDEEAENSQVRERPPLRAVGAKERKGVNERGAALQLERLRIAAGAEDAEQSVADRAQNDQEGDHRDQNSEPAVLDRPLEKRQDHGRQQREEGLHMDGVSTAPITDHTVRTRRTPCALTSWT